MVRCRIFPKTCIMKKIFAVGASLFLVIVSANAQTEKKEPPPPPPKPKEVKVKEEKIIEPVIVDERTNPTKPLEPPVITVTGKMADVFYKRNPGVSDILRKGSIITVKKKDGTIEKYDMNKKDEDKSFTERYGVSPIPPPPPPPKKVS